MGLLQSSLLFSTGWCFFLFPWGLPQLAFPEAWHGLF